MKQQNANIKHTHNNLMRKGRIVKTKLRLRPISLMLEW